MQNADTLAALRKELSNPCDHKRQTCEEVGCLAPLLRAAAAALAEREGERDTRPERFRAVLGDSVKTRLRIECEHILTRAAYRADGGRKVPAPVYVEALATEMELWINEMLSEIPTEVRSQLLALGSDTAALRTPEPAERECPQCSREPNAEGHDETCMWDLATPQPSAERERLPTVDEVRGILKHATPQLSAEQHVEDRRASGRVLMKHAKPAHCACCRHADPSAERERIARILWEETELAVRDRDEAHVPWSQADEEDPETATACRRAADRILAERERGDAS